MQSVRLISYLFGINSVIKRHSSNLNPFLTKWQLDTLCVIYDTWINKKLKLGSKMTLLLSFQSFGFY